MLIWASREEQNGIEVRVYWMSGVNMRNICWCIIIIIIIIIVVVVVVWGTR
jgi:predicted anti-sigma-YlaC factor YlaD